MLSVTLIQQLRSRAKVDEPVIDEGQSGQGVEEFCPKGHIETSNLQSSRPETTAMILWPDGDLRVMRIIVIADKILDLGL